MAIILPTLDNKQRDDRVQILKQNPIVPVSTQWALTVNGTTYATADASTLGQYTTNSIQLPSSYGIVAIRLSNFLQTITDGLIIAVSYSPIFTVAAYGGTPTVPDEQGNVIYRAICTQAGYNEHLVMQSGGQNLNNFFVPSNIPIYVHQWASAAAITAASMVAQGFLTLYCQYTGVRS